MNLIRLAGRVIALLVGVGGLRYAATCDTGSWSFPWLGYFVYPIEQIYELSLSVEKPKPIAKSSNSDDHGKTTNATPTYSARIYAHAGRKTYILLETAFHQPHSGQVRSKLIPVIESLAQALQVSWYER